MIDEWKNCIDLWKIEIKNYIYGRFLKNKNRRLKIFIEDQDIE